MYICQTPVSDAQQHDPTANRLLRQRDEQAWQALMQTHQQALFRLAYLLLGDAADADDVAQEAFIRAYRAIATFDPERPVKPWLLAITANLARNRRRSLARFAGMLKRLVFSEPALIAPAEHPVPHTVAQRQRADLLWRAVRRLTLADQEVIYLRHFMALSEAETAEALRVAIGTVKSRSSRALTRLKAVIERDFPELDASDEAP